jgi:lysophospholipase L1-like esterase
MNIFLIGDSISIGYTPEVTRLLVGKATVTRNPGNAQYSSWGLRHLRQWLDTARYDVIHFNFGIWDLHRLKPGADPLEPSTDQFDPNGVRRTTPEQYAGNLEEIVAILKTTGAKLIWAATTPIRALPGIAARADEIPLYNTVARQVMTRHGIPINDLFQTPLELLSPDGVHFTDDGYRHLGRKVAAMIERNLLNQGTLIRST